MMNRVLSKFVLPIAFFAVGLLGYRLGAGQNHQLPVQTVTLENVQVMQIHPAALYVRTPNGKEQRYLMDALEQDWASGLLQLPKSHWYLKLTTSPWCSHRYLLQTAVEQSNKE